MARRSLKPKAAVREAPVTNVDLLRAKVCLVGDAAVGKTSLVRRYVLDVFDDSYLRTVGTKVSKRTMDLAFPRDRVAVRLVATIWDIMGHSGFRDLVSDTYFTGANGILAVADLTRRTTLDNLVGWIEGVHHIAGNVPVVLVVNKADLASDATYGADEIEDLAAAFGCPHVTSSAKTGENVPTAFELLGTRMAAMQLGLSSAPRRAIATPSA